ncbi:hypothetical protein RFI_29542 [Reticulomyxa filosa]|uniref:Uncharacterized protein n=1 Tax=Reticulomyxa filosa TaxID=46433 RepID=X6M1T9_RETFI|nr:hypothetical protein RFI_29542 [Reticulomyxa filosa]|eukprot:ETO07849.1 hypothetical protein RFI_29542 [Reticulomyxa filosa]
MCNFEGQALNIAPEYYYLERTLTLTNTDEVLRYIIQYITSCGCHGACFTQICVALEQIYDYQQDRFSVPMESSCPRDIGTRMCQYNHELFKDRFGWGHGTDKKTKSRNVLIYGYLFGEWIIYLDNVMGSNSIITKKWLPNSINKKIPFQLYEMNIAKSLTIEAGQEMEVTKDGIKYPCMKYRTKCLNVSWLKQICKKITKECNAQHIINRYINLFDTIYFVSDSWLKNRLSGWSCIIPPICLELQNWNERNDKKQKFNCSTVQACALELLMRAGVQGIGQPDLANELNLSFKEIFQILKQFHHFNLIVKYRSPVYGRAFTYVWLKQFVCNKVIVRYMKWGNENGISERTLELRNLYRSNKWNELKTLRILPFSHCFSQYVQLQCADHCNLHSQKIRQEIVPYLYSILNLDEYRRNGISCDSLKQMMCQHIQSIDYENIPWNNIQEILLQTYPHQLEFTRNIYPNNVVQMVIRLKSSNNDNEITDEKVRNYNDIMHSKIGKCWDMNRALQLYNKISDSGIKGILSTDLAIQFQISKKELTKLLNYCLKTFDIVRTVDTLYTSTTFRYFTKQHFQTLAQINSNIKKMAKDILVQGKMSKRNSKKTQSLLSPRKSRQIENNTNDNTKTEQIKIENENTQPTELQAPKSFKFLNRREQILDYLKNNDGMATSLELRRYLRLEINK